MKASLIALLFCHLAFAQTTTAKKKDAPAPPEPFAVNVSGATWEPGELRTCSTFFNHPKFLLCDNDTRLAIVTGYRWTPSGQMESIDREKLIRSLETDRSKRFLVQFSKLPWRLAQPDSRTSDEPPPVFATPDGKSPDMESQWDCSKEKTITCNLLRSF
jgi:hypothetical protein